MSSPQRTLTELMTSEAHADDLRERALALRCEAMRSTTGNASRIRRAQLLEMQARAILRSGRVA